MSSPSLPAESLKPPRAEVRWLALMLIVASLLRLGLVCWKPDSLAEDRDLYWGIARRLAAGDGFVHPEWGHATAYRPPLYPLMLAGIVVVGGGWKTLAVVQIALDTATVWLTWLLGRRLGLERWAFLAAGFVAVNPLLLHATSLAMTETLCTFLVILCLRAFLSEGRWACGLLLGLAALCRPTLWAFASLAAGVVILQQVRRGMPSARTRRTWGLVVITCLITVAPWVIRNEFIFGEP
ncbi:MAG TPA: glycosyltransferase family 39 protein, partial [Planctomycetaceae bacterium]|nr:glycosyltransferase family 39 protein [Planctomycetaceae bacterium]